METLNKDLILQQIDDVRQELQIEYPDRGPDPNWAKKRMHNISLISSLINRITPPGSSFRKDLEKLSKDCNLSDYTQSERMAESLVGLLRALRFDYEKGYLVSVTKLIHADLFEDFMSMGEHLLKEGYSLPAAVVIGSVLEENLRKLCIFNGISIVREKEDKEVPLAASSLNSELRKANIYNKLVEKQITAWLDIRNSAAHGQNNEFTPQDVESMYRDVLRFLTDYPA